MERYTISADSGADELVPVALCIHELMNRLPVTARSRDRKGIRIEKGEVLDRAYTGPVLEEVLRLNRLLKTRPASGQYKGIPVVVAPVRNDRGEAIAAIGIVDITGIFDLATLMEHHSDIIKQVCGKDPCPLPTETVGSKR
ncbi:MAG: DUF2111 domain-containing protein [Methanomicrobiales archaeon]|nr:DUF2111 domain-containing protein [Methanomicrobiales archaeon]